MAEKKTIKEPNQCGNCGHGELQVQRSIEKGSPPITICHRLPPGQATNERKPDPYPFPRLFSTEWCSEHKKKG